MFTGYTTYTTTFMSTKIIDSIKSFGYTPGDTVWLETNGIKIDLLIISVGINHGINQMVLSDLAGCNETTFVYNIDTNRWTGHGIEYIIGQGEEETEEELKREIDTKMANIKKNEDKMNKISEKVVTSTMLLLNEIDKTFALCSSSDEKAFPLLLKYHSSIGILPIAIQALFKYELGKWYRRKGKYEKAIELFSFACSKTCDSKDKDEKKLGISSLKELCICCFRTNNIPNHEIHCRELGEIYKNSNLEISFDWIINEPEYKKWIIDNKLSASEFIHIQIPRDPKVVEFLIEKDAPHIIFLKEQGVYYESDTSADDLFEFGEKCFEEGKIENALKTFSIFLTDPDLPNENEEIYHYILACLHLLSKLNPIEYGKKAIIIYNKYIRFSDYVHPDDISSLWTDKHQGLKEWMIEVCPKFKKHSGVKEESTTLKTLTLSAEQIEEKNKEINRLKEQLAMTEALRNQPTQVVDKKEAKDSSKKKKQYKKKKGTPKVVVDTPKVGTLEGRSKSVPEVTIIKGNQKKDIYITSMKPPQEVKKSIIKKDDKLVSLLLLSVPVPIITKEKKTPKPSKKITLAEFLDK